MSVLMTDELKFKNFNVNVFWNIENSVKKSHQKF